MLAGIELDKYASGHKMSNQESEKPDLPEAPNSPKTKMINGVLLLDRLGKTGRYLQLLSFTFFALHDLYSGQF